MVIEHFEPNQVHAGGNANDGAEMVLKVETRDRVLVIWRCASSEDPGFVLDTEDLMDGRWRYRRVETYSRGFRTLGESLNGLGRILADELT